MPSQIEKLQAHASHLLDAFIILKERYSMLHPMIFDKAVGHHFGSNERTRGFEVLRHSLLLSCTQDIAKLALDKDERTPSILNLMLNLENEVLRQNLRDEFSKWETPVIVGQEDPEVIDALKIWGEQETRDRADQFDKYYQSAVAQWESIQSSKIFYGFLAVRNKVSAHLEIRYVADKYQFVDISNLGLKMGDLKSAIDQMQELIVLIELIIRNAGFSWDTLDERLSEQSEDFWNPSDIQRGE